MDVDSLLVLFLSKGLSIFNFTINLFEFVRQHNTFICDWKISEPLIKLSLIETLLYFNNSYFLNFVHLLSFYTSIIVILEGRVDNRSPEGWWRNDQYHTNRRPVLEWFTTQRGLFNEQSECTCQLLDSTFLIITFFTLVSC